MMGFDWRRKVHQKLRRGSQTPGKQKVNCSATPLQRYMARRSRSYKHPEYPIWYEKSKRAAMGGR